MLTGLIIVMVMSAGAPATLSAQRLITMSNKCVKRMKAGDEANAAGNYQEALSLFQQALQKCKAKDAIQQGNIGIAHAYNALGNYTEAIAAAELAIGANANNVRAYFERGVANSKLGDITASKADFDKIIELTEKNRNTTDRATIFAEIAQLSWKQGLKDEASLQLEKAIAYDPDNPDFYVLRGEMYADDGQMDRAFYDFDKAVSMGKADLDMYTIRATNRLKAMQRKYGTTETNALGQKMTPEEKGLVCADLNKAFSLGLKDMQMDLFRTFICN